MRCTGAQLIFISQIKRDGSGVDDIDEEYRRILKKEDFKVIRLSLSEDTYIAHGFNAFVVRLAAVAEPVKEPDFRQVIRQAIKDLETENGKGLDMIRDDLKSVLYLMVEFGFLKFQL